jgi:phosphoribosylformylglycinamidine synthase
MVLASGIGADLALPPEADAGWLFGEDQGRYLLAVAVERQAAVLEAARQDGVLARPVGTTGGAALTLAGGDAISMGELSRAHEDWLPGLMAARGESRRADVSLEVDGT